MTQKISRTMVEAPDMLRLFMLALCVWREARGESVKGKVLVATTIRNRVADKRWPNTYVGVITQPKQFSSFNANDPNVTKFPAENDGDWAACLGAAQKALALDTPISTANHYHTVNVSPAWKDDSKVVAREGAHIFYCL